ncbi:MAG TPA: TRAP transporter substrate-binding protein [Stellaceae bacterium]|nr:TRAP transporter substrate-binding protein [Stellaceae bacterium]
MRGVRRSRWCAALASLVLWAAFAAQAAAAEFVMKFGIATINETQHQFIKMYKAALEEATGGRIEVQLFPASQLGTIQREIEGVQFGSIQAYMGPVDFFVGIEPRFGVFSAPMLFRDEAHATAVVHDPALEQKMLGLAEAKGLVGMAVIVPGVSHYAARHALMRLADFQGKKLRINGSELERAKMAKLGATGVAMALSEVAPALDQGVIDGTISGLSIFVSMKMSNLVKVVTVTNDTMLVSIAMVSKRWLDGLPPDLRKKVIDTGLAIQPKAQEWEQAFNKDLEKQWDAMGGSVHPLPAEDLAKMRTLLLPVGDEVTKDQPQVHAMLEEVRKVAEKY